MERKRKKILFKSEAEPITAVIWKNWGTTWTVIVPAAIPRKYPLNTTDKPTFHINPLNPELSPIC
jgi:hypothetical protein